MWDLAKWERLKGGRDRRRQADGGSGERRGAGVCVCVCVCVCVKRAVNLDARNGSTPVPSRALRRVSVADRSALISPKTDYANARPPFAPPASSNRDRRPRPD